MLTVQEVSAKLEKAQKYFSTEVPIAWAPSHTLRNKRISLLAKILRRNIQEIESSVVFDLEKVVSESQLQFQGKEKSKKPVSRRTISDYLNDLGKYTHLIYTARRHGQYTTIKPSLD